MLPTQRNVIGRCVLMLAVGLIGLAVAALACAPAAPAGQDAATPLPAPTDEPTAAPTAEPTAAPTKGPWEAWDGTGNPPPPPTLTQLERQLQLQYAHVDGNLMQIIEDYEASAGASGVSGSGGSEQPAPTPELINLIVYVDTSEEVDALEIFLEQNGASQILCGRPPPEDIIRGGCNAYVPVWLLRSLADLPGVLLMEKQRPARPASGRRSPSGQRTPVDAHGVAAWRLAGANGAGQALPT